MLLPLGKLPEGKGTGISPGYFRKLFPAGTLLSGTPLRGTFLCRTLFRGTFLRTLFRTLLRAFFLGRVGHLRPFLARLRKSNGNRLFWIRDSLSAAAALQLAPLHRVHLALH